MTNETTINTDFVGQDFDEFLAEEGIAADVQARAIKKVGVALLENPSLTQTELAKQMQSGCKQ